MELEFTLQGERGENRFTAPVTVTGTDIDRFSDGDDRATPEEAAKEKFLDSVEEPSEFDYIEVT